MLRNDEKYKSRLEDQDRRMKRGADAKSEKKDVSDVKVGKDIEVDKKVTEDEPNKTAHAGPEDEEDVTFWADVFETADAQPEENRSAAASAPAECGHLWAEQAPLETIVEEVDMDVGDDDGEEEEPDGDIPLLDENVVVPEDEEQEMPGRNKRRRQSEPSEPQEGGGREPRPKKGRSTSVLACGSSGRNKCHAGPNHGHQEFQDVGDHRLVLATSVGRHHDLLVQKLLIQCRRQHCCRRYYHPHFVKSRPMMRYRPRICKSKRKSGEPCEATDRRANAACQVHDKYRHYSYHSSKLDK